MKTVLLVNVWQYQRAEATGMHNNQSGPNGSKDTDRLLFVKHTSKITNYILLFLLSYSSFLDCGLVPFIGKFETSSLIEAESGATVRLVNADKARGKRKTNQCHETRPDKRLTFRR
jgi:hypothetical protein